MKNSHLENAKIFKAFCDETRLMVLSLLQSGEKCACELLVRVSVKQPTLSHHMKILVESGIVASRKHGKWMYYSISQEGCQGAAALLNELTEVTSPNNENKKECCEWIKDAVPQIAAVATKPQSKCQSQEMFAVMKVQS